MTVQIRGARALCRTIVTEETMPGGKVILLDRDRERITQQQAEVVAVGPGDYDAEGDFVPADSMLQPGAWIVHAPFARQPWRDDPNEFLIDFKDIVVILDTDGT